MKKCKIIIEAKQKEKSDEFNVDFKINGDSNFGEVLQVLSHVARQVNIMAMENKVKK